MTGAPLARRSGWIAAARGANALFFLLTSTYCILTYNSFAYQQFIRPRLVSSLATFVAFHHLWHWVLLGITVATLLPEWRTSRGRVVAWSYVATMAVLGLVILYRPLLPAVENDALGLWLACGFLVPPMWLAVYDHCAAAGAFHPATVDTRRLVITSIATALAVWSINVVCAPLRFDELGDLTTTRSGLLFGAGVSLVVHVAVFGGIATVLAILLTVVSRRPASAPRLQYVVIAACTCGFTLLTVWGLVFGSLSFTGAAAWLVALEVAVALTATWSGIVLRMDATRGAPGIGASQSALDAWLAPVPGVGSNLGALAGLVLLPFALFVLLRRVERFDWNFLVQNLCVVAGWLLVSALVHQFVRHSTPRSVARPVAFSAAAVLAIVGIGAGGSVETPFASRVAGQPFVPEFVLDAYATVDPSYRLMRHVLAVEPAGTREYFNYLRAHSLIQHVDVQPVDVDFVRPLRPAASRPPHIFFFVIDSLRRDYVSAYNPTVTFTPAFDAFAREGFAFQRAFTRYGGTGLSMPAIWAGSMILHKEYVLPFQRMNALEKLITVNGYRPVMSMDHITAQIVAPGLQVDELDKGRDEMQYDLCATLEELQGKLSTGLAEGQPLFAHTRSLNLHTSKLIERVGAPDPAYGGFQAAAAANVRRIDGCFGRFITYLKQKQLYDDSIVIVTSDHGDALGEARRWGHAYTLFPEIVRTPLLVHIPSKLTAQFTADVDAASFSTDITPSLYALLGYREAQHEWPLGQSLFVPPGTDTSWRRHEPVVVASSYGPVYGVLRDNGQSLYIADGVNSLDYAYDLTALKPIRVGVTPQMRSEDRALIREKVGALASMYHFTPSP